MVSCSEEQPGLAWEVMMGLPTLAARMRNNEVSVPYESKCIVVPPAIPIRWRQQALSFEPGEGFHQAIPQGGVSRRVERSSQFPHGKEHASTRADVRLRGGAIKDVMKPKLEGRQASYLRQHRYPIVGPVSGPCNDPSEILGYHSVVCERGF